jgi:C1A family cysteine protease
MGANIMSNNSFGMGWLRDNPDMRDYTLDQDDVKPKFKILEQRSVKDDLKKVGVLKESAPKLPAVVDLRQWCAPIEDQRSLGSCTANAGVGVVEYFERRSFGRYIDASRLFLYKVTRNLMGWTGDTGAYLRTTMAALALFGTPPERYWPYTDAQPNFDEEPSAFCYAFGQNYQAIRYYRLDPGGTSTATLLSRIKTWLAAGLPSMFGFSVYSSYTQASATGEFPYPTSGESVVGGHAVVAVGYDDGKHIMNANPGASETVGALLIRNSWGTSWGTSGYGWLPYDYVLKRLAVDWWSLIKSEWIDTNNFGP